jgi:uncharacterized protein YbcV (DUF1398 family)
MTPGTPLVSGTVEVPPFDRDALITALRIDQAGESTFAKFLEASCRARSGSLRSRFLGSHCELLRCLP